MSTIGDALRAVGRLFSPSRDRSGRVERASGFPEAIPSPQDTKIFTQGALPDWNLEQGWDRRYMVDRAQQMHRGNLLAGSILDRSADHVLGPGYRIQPSTGDKGFNREARLAWEEWCGTPNLCDIRGRSTYWDMARETYIGEQRDGDAGMLLREDAGEGKVRVVNSVEIASPVGGFYKTTEVDGVERSLDGKHLAYWIHDPDVVAYPNVRAALHRLMRVPAKDFVFWARTPLGAQQTRGITAFLGTFMLLEQVDGTIISIAKKAQIAARFAMVITKKSMLSQGSFGGIPTRRPPTTRVEDGTITRLEIDEDIKPVQSMDPNANLIDLIKILVRICGTRFCLSLATIMLDHSDHNFSNARASAIEINNGTLIRQMKVAQNSSAIYEMKGLEWMRKGRLRVSALKGLGRQDREMKALKHLWYFPARPLIDPLTERQADLLGLDMGTETWARIAAREGLTAPQLFRRQAQERKMRARLKLPDVRSNMTRESVETIVTKSGKTDEPNDAGPKKNGKACASQEPAGISG